MQVPLGVVFKNRINWMKWWTSWTIWISMYLQRWHTQLCRYLGVHQKECNLMSCTRCKGGDQLTVARIKSAKRLCEDSQHDARHLDGFIPVVEDWHTKVCLLEVRLFHAFTLLYYAIPCMVNTIAISPSGHVGTPLPERGISGFWNTAKPHQSFKCSSEAQEHYTPRCNLKNPRNITYIT